MRKIICILMLLLFSIGITNAQSSQTQRVLKEIWLSAFPDSTHPLDIKRFIRYAVELAKENGTLDHSEMESRGVSPHRREEYQRQYEFLRYVLEVLDER